MKKQEHIDAILDSFDGIKRAETRPFMYTRVRARIQEESNFWMKTSSVITRPLVAVCCLVSIITVNVYLIIDADHRQKAETMATAGTESDILQNENFILASNTGYDFNK
ncbi:hypothetical protein [Niabella beijingensis]|uniref:hypothetical protein n=1 Tax=Niabella beijingensis TaxID=2872700 RepID=UPI001CC0B6DA|nr:hypothetical protein [Niabella beijingensis]MBZ4189800.1 hypothetical protein [Niabella beijingensis]